MFRKILFINFLFSTLLLGADDLADILQNLAIQTACRGKYSTAYTGVSVKSQNDDPYDWYNPPMIANRFTAMSGNMARANTFYGVCFDYAYSAWNEINKYQEMYKKAGMKDQKWYIASTNQYAPYNIILYTPSSKEESTIIMNGVYLKEKARYNVYAHDGATGHSWLWVQHVNGTWYWIDPTWTDNTGYPWWGIVENGKEKINYPNPALCVASNYPCSTQLNKPSTDNGTKTPATSYIPYIPSTPSKPSTIYNKPAQGSTSGLFFGYITSFNFDYDNKFGFTLSWEDILPYEKGLVTALSFDYLVNKNVQKKNEDDSFYLLDNETESLNAMILGITAGYQFLSHFVLYAGGGAGGKFPSNNGWFTWKVNGGLRVQLGWFFTKFDLSYNPIIGTALSTGLGIAFK